jgi:hypothetical protein
MNAYDENALDVISSGKFRDTAHRWADEGIPDTVPRRLGEKVWHAPGYTQRGTEDV